MREFIPYILGAATVVVVYIFRAKIAAKAVELFGKLRAKLPF